MLRQGTQSELEGKDKYLQIMLQNITPKVHAVFHQVSKFCDLTKKGLSPWSEQITESLHHDFNQI